MLLEVIAESVEDALEAERGGAGRIELVRDRSRGGLTPPVSLIEAVLAAVRIPVRVMLRESESFEAADPGDLVALHAAAVDARARGAAGFVTGFLRGGAPHLAAVRQVLGTLTGPVTFHRAFDAAARQLEAVVAIGAETRIDRLLTSGGSGPWEARLAQLIACREAAPSHLIILPGGGLDDAALGSLAAARFVEAHVGRAARVPAADDGRVRASRVAELVAIVQTAARRGASNPA